MADLNAVPGRTKDVDPGTTTTCVNNVKQHQYLGRVKKKKKTKDLASLRKSKQAAVQPHTKNGSAILLNALWS